MRLSTLLAVASIAAESGLGAATSKCGCTKPVVRKEWRTLSTDQKHEYIAAIKCLASKPSQTGGIYPGAKSRYDDFVATHIVNTNYIHFVGFFQAWHRVFVNQYEKDLRNLCGWTGGQPYWNWSLDSDSVEDFLCSPLFDPETGFGGNGPFINSTGWTNITRQIPNKLGGGCVVDGPLVEGQWPVNMGPEKNTAYNSRCLRRDIAPEFAITKLNQARVDWTLEAEDYYEFDVRVEGGITVPTHGYHGGGHLGVGGDLGEVGDVYTSPGDPLFFMHHANMDRLWTKWQYQDWPARRRDIGGPDTQFAYPFAFFGDVDYKNVTLDYVMNFDKLIPGRQHFKIRDVMDIEGGALCYSYEE
ncbi:hypothetical protein QQZ08_003829 [Neonectria magnoliae]|uniref:Tyrosinase copper-binding domain-containing protein n=1 Tax=Neonectria magnoliae TaxID=2732573 RepID=A0ABR1I9D3_9HYPO